MEIFVTPLLDDQNFITPIQELLYHHVTPKVYISAISLVKIFSKFVAANYLLIIFDLFFFFFFFFANIILPESVFFPFLSSVNISLTYYPSGAAAGSCIVLISSLFLSGNTSFFTYFPTCSSYI